MHKVNIHLYKIKIGDNMLSSEIKPFIRFARYLNLTKNTFFEEVIPLDSRLFYTLNGFGKIKVDNIEYEMSPHSLLIINSGIPYQILPPASQVNYVVINFDFIQKSDVSRTPTAPVTASTFKKEMLLNHITFSDSKELSGVLYIKEIPVIQMQLKTIIAEQRQKLIYYEMRSGYILADCLIESLRFAELGNKKTKKENASAILSFIHDNFQKNLTYHLIGNHFGYHPNYISFMIKKLTGMTLHRYLIYVRLSNATYLLENTALSCREIAEECGFIDSSHFSRCFKNYFGTSPSRHRSI